MDSNVPAADIEAIRAQFPALRRRHNGESVAYFDGPGGTQVPERVVEAVGDYLRNHNANTHWAFPTSHETDDALASARHALADFLGATPGEIAFGANMTSLTFHVSRALGRSYSPCDEVVVTELDHHANSDPWREMAREHDVAVRVARMDPATGLLDMDDLLGMIHERTRVVAIGAASNALGTITDLAAVVQRAHEAEALVFVDAVHFAPHRLVDVAALGCDALACSAYKFYGPHVGVLYVRRELLEALDVPKLRPAPDTAPERLETGTLNHEGIVGAAAAVEFLASLGGPGQDRRSRLRVAFEVLHTRSEELFSRLWEGLATVERVRHYGPPPGADRTPTVSFTVAGVPSGEVARKLADRGLFLSHGNFYAATVVERLGLASDGLVRAGLACYTTGDEVDRLVEGVRAIAAGG